jgi:hypothetical protein
MNILSIEIERANPPTESPWPLPKGQHVVLSPDLRAEWWGRWGTSGRVWCVIDFDADENWFDTYSDFDGEVPEWFANYDGGVTGLLGISLYDKALEFLLHNGIAPGQAFRIEFKFASGVDYFACLYGEGWDEFHYTVIDREKWSDEQVRNAWLRWNAAQTTEPPKETEP